jgi:hypothetical protein
MQNSSIRSTLFHCQRVRKIFSHMQKYYWCITNLIVCVLHFQSLMFGIYYCFAIIFFWKYYVTWNNLHDLNFWGRPWGASWLSVGRPLVAFSHESFSHAFITVIHHSWLLLISSFPFERIKFTLDHEGQCWDQKLPPVSQ